MRLLHFLCFFHFVLACLDNLYNYSFYITGNIIFFLKYIIVCYWNYMHIILVYCILFVVV